MGVETPKQNGERNERLWTNGGRRLDVWSWVIMATLAFCGWMAVEIVEIKEHVAQLSGNRFTSNDGLKLYEQIIRLQSQEPWLIKRMDNIEIKLESIESKLHTHNARPRDTSDN